jgi:transketolase
VMEGGRLLLLRPNIIICKTTIGAGSPGRAEPTSAACRCTRSG